MERQGYGFDEPEHYETDDDAQLTLLGASLAGRAALGLRAGRKVRRYQVLGGRTVRLPPRCAVCDGYNLHAGVVVRDAEARERLCRYVARPPLAKTRIEQREDGEMVVRLRRAWSDGTSAFVFSPLEFLERLAALIPPPRIHQIHYQGVLAPRHSSVTKSMNSIVKKILHHPVQHAQLLAKSNQTTELQRYLSTFVKAEDTSGEK